MRTSDVQVCLRQQFATYNSQPAASGNFTTYKSACGVQFETYSSQAVASDQIVTYNRVLLCPTSA